MNKLLEKIKIIAKDPCRAWYLFLQWLATKSIFRGLVSDKAAMSVLYRLRMDQRLNLKNPTTFNEKIQWLKLHDRKPEYVMMADKYAVRPYIEKQLGEEYLIPLLGAWDSFDEIDFDALPEQFVLKCNHDSHSVMICHDKAKFDKAAAKAKLSYALTQNWYWQGRQWAYKDIKPKIIAEQYMQEDDGGDLRDYKFFCFNGTPELIQVSLGGDGERTLSYFDMQWERLSLERLAYKTVEDVISKPPLFEELKECAQRLAQGKYFARIDFYCCNQQIYFGEITFYPGSGVGKFKQEEWDIRLGEKIILPCDAQ